MLHAFPSETEALYAPGRCWRPSCAKGRRPLARRDRRRLRRRRGERAVLNASSRSRQTAIAGPISTLPHHLLRSLSGSLGRVLFSSYLPLPAGHPSPLSVRITELHRQEAIRQPKRTKILTIALVYDLEHPPCRAQPLNLLERQGMILSTYSSAKTRSMQNTDVYLVLGSGERRRALRGTMRRMER